MNDFIQSLDGVADLKHLLIWALMGEGLIFVTCLMSIMLQPGDRSNNLQRLEDKIDKLTDRIRDLERK